MNLMDTLKVSETGLSANRIKMNVIAVNLANVETTSTPEGGPYQRKMVVFKAKSEKNFENVFGKSNNECQGVEVSKIVKSQKNFTMVYNPNHPDANKDGYVAMPNVDLLTEMADMVVARRAYDANAAVISNTKAMITKSLELLK